LAVGRRRLSADSTAKRSRWQSGGQRAACQGVPIATLSEIHGCHGWPARSRPSLRHQRIATFMKRLGIIGGIEPESTIVYYRAIVAAGRERLGGGAPPILLNSIDVQKVLRLAEDDPVPGLRDCLVSEITVLARAGVSVGLMAANTPHIVFDEVRQQSPIALVSIVEAARDAARERGLTRLAVLGTKFTMQGRFYQDVFLPSEVLLVRPTADEQAFIHDKRGRPTSTARRQRPNLPGATGSASGCSRQVEQVPSVHGTRFSHSLLTRSTCTAVHPQRPGAHEILAGDRRTLCHRPARLRVALRHSAASFVGTRGRCGGLVVSPRVGLHPSS